MSQRKKLKKRQQRRLYKIFLRTVAITFMVLVCLGGIGVFLYQHYLYDGSNLGLLEPKKNDPINKTLAVFGVDEEGIRTDVIFVLNYNSETGKMRVISIPRDTKVEWTSEQQALALASKGYTVEVSKINEMTAYAGIDQIRQLTIAQIEDLMDIQVDNYVIITLDAFKKIVDAIGGVEVDVPALSNGKGLHYQDKSQGLYIDLEPGLQLLDGEKAEGLVRFRKGYADADVGRIKTQQLFLEAFAKKVTSPAVITKVPNIIKAVLETVTTDIKLSEIAGYIPYIKSMDASQLKCDIVPGESRYIGNKSYFIVDEEAIPGFMIEVFSDEEEEEEVEKVVIDQSVSVQILNSTPTTGLAGKQKTTLEAAGYSVSDIGNYTLSVLDKTIIYARDERLGKQFLSYYSGALVKQDPNIPYDICIVLGNDIAQ